VIYQRISSEIKFNETRSRTHDCEERNLPRVIVLCRRAENSWTRAIDNVTEMNKKIQYVKNNVKITEQN